MDNKYEVARCDRCGEKLRDLNDVTCATLPCYHVKINWRDYILCESCRNELDLFMVNPNYHPHLPPANNFCGYPPTAIKELEEYILKGLDDFSKTYSDESVLNDEPEDNVAYVVYKVVNCETGEVVNHFITEAGARILADELNLKNGGYGYLVLCDESKTVT